MASALYFRFACLLLKNTKREGNLFTITIHLCASVHRKELCTCAREKVPATEIEFEIKLQEASIAYFAVCVCMQ